MKPRSIVALLILWCHAIPATGQTAKLLPVDEASRQPDFLAFRARLLVALARRDTSALLRTVAPEIRSSFGDDNGAAAFRRRWRLEAQDSELWGELAAVLALGGTFENDSTFVAPYVFGRWPAGFDSFEYMAVIASNVRIRSKPSFTAPVLARVSFELVKRAPTTPSPLTPAEGAIWEPVQFRNRQIGYVAKELVRSPVGYRAVFVRRNNGWVMITLIAGD